MIDRLGQRPVRVLPPGRSVDASEGGAGGPHILVSTPQAPAVRRVLERGGSWFRERPDWAAGQCLFTVRPGDAAVIQGALNAIVGQGWSSPIPTSSPGALPGKFPTQGLAR